MSKNFLKILFFSRVQFLIVSIKCPKFLMIFNFLIMSKKFLSNFTSIHQFSLPSSTISPYFNSSYYSFFYIFDTVSNFVQYISNFFSPLTQGGGLTPKPLPCLRPCPWVCYTYSYWVVFRGCAIPTAIGLF